MSNRKEEEKKNKNKRMGRGVNRDRSCGENEEISKKVLECARKKDFITSTNGL